MGVTRHSIDPQSTAIYAAKGAGQLQTKVKQGIKGY